MASDPALRAKGITFDEAARLDPDDEAGELDAGRWVPVTRSTWRHGEIVGNAYALLRSYARAHPGWRVAVADPGTKLGRDPDILRGPDTAIVRAERAPTGRGAAGWLEGAPDVAVEVIGDAQPASELTKKALEYLAAGARMVWVLDPEPRQVMVFTPPGGLRVVGPDDTLDGAEVLPGFSAKVAEFFE
jgi:Uma2 family endonuclease